MKSSLSIPASTIALLLIDLQEEHRHDTRYLVEGYGDVLANRLYGGAITDSDGAWRLQPPVPIRFRSDDLERNYAE